MFECQHKMKYTYKKLWERKSVAAERVQCEYLAVADTDTVNCEESGEGARKMGE